MPPLDANMKSELDRTARNLKDIMSTLSYIQAQAINSRLVYEKEWVAVRFKELNKNKMPNWNRDQGWKRWEKKDLEGGRNKFRKQQVEVAEDNAVKYIDDSLRSLEDGYLTEYMEQANQPSREN